jgi:ubiquinone/menaquinone biosynthesis C-methylase UbiE
MIAPTPPGDALDAACGTGRHAATLVEFGHRVVGVDTTEAMLAIARKKVPSADFRSGRLEQLPVEDETIDLITCALALTHVERLEPVMREFARVLRPGGQAILTDIHPVATMTGGIAGFPDRDISHGIPYVRNLTHPVSDYVTSFLDVGLSIVACVEPCVTDSMLKVFPSYPILPDATRQAFLDTPYLLIWHLERPAPPT